MSKDAYLTVTALNQYVKTLLESDTNLVNITVRGEVSNFKVHPTGLYFSLKDENAVISAAMFRYALKNIDFPIKNGDEVLATGQISLFTGRGTYQIIVREIVLFGEGAKLLALEKLKKKLAAEGLFAPERKKKLVAYPQNVGIITGEKSAAESDLLKNLARRFPLVKVHLFPALVQGENAPKDLRRAVQLSKNYPLDVLIIARGGGSSEDLWAFNDENLIYDLSQYPYPVIAAVGHEVDQTLVDYIADARASTPTGACELAVPDQNELLQRLKSQSERLNMGFLQKIALAKRQISNLSSRPVLQNPLASFAPVSARLEKYQDQLLYPIKRKVMSYHDLFTRLEQRLTFITHQISHHYRSRLQVASEKLCALSPKAVLSRGYAFLTTEDDQIIKSIAALAPGQIVKTTIDDGTIISEIIETRGQEDE
ncbi:MAG: exodeoxyribonuclease VII large subunit [Bacilli bacterium]|jgi:exodeoxyribonuclease VII large subunit